MAPYSLYSALPLGPGRKYCTKKGIGCHLGLSLQIVSIKNNRDHCCWSSTLELLIVLYFKGSLGLKQYKTLDVMGEVEVGAREQCWMKKQQVDGMKDGVGVGGRMVMEVKRMMGLEVTGGCVRVCA